MNPFYALIVLQEGPPGGGEPAHPIHIPIPPDFIAPGVPSHPIYIPVFPGHPIVIPPGAFAPERPAHPIVIPRPPCEPGEPEPPLTLPPGSVAPGLPAAPLPLPMGEPIEPPKPCGDDHKKRGVIEPPPIPDDVPEGAKLLLVMVPGYGWQWVVVPPAPEPAEES